MHLQMPVCSSEWIQQVLSFHCISFVKTVATMNLLKFLKAIAL